MDENLEGDLSKNGETGLVVKDDVGLESLSDMHVQEGDMLAFADETDLQDLSSVDDGKQSFPDTENVPSAVLQTNGEQSFPDVESVPSAVLQTNGEFMCSCCGVRMKCARAIKRHISTHMSLQSFQPHATLSCETADNIDDVSKDDVTQKLLSKKQPNSYNKLSAPGTSIGIHKRLPVRHPASTKDIDIKWRSYPCKDCDIMCTSSALLQLHRVQMHKPHQCQKCGTVLAGRRNFSQHVRKEHPGQHICKVPHCQYLLVFVIIRIG